MTVNEKSMQDLANWIEKWNFILKNEPMPSTLMAEIAMTELERAVNLDYKKATLGMTKESQDLKKQHRKGKLG